MLRNLGYYFSGTKFERISQCLYALKTGIYAILIKE